MTILFRTAVRAHQQRQRQPIQFLLSLPLTAPPVDFMVAKRDCASPSLVFVSYSLSQCRIPLLYLLCFILVPLALLHLYPLHLYPLPPLLHSPLPSLPLLSFLPPVLLLTPSLLFPLLPLPLSTSLPSTSVSASKVSCDLSSSTVLPSRLMSSLCKRLVTLLCCTVASLRTHSSSHMAAPIRRESVYCLLLLSSLVCGGIIVHPPVDLLVPCLS